eukprot:jgi/Ulvmu1/6168/UM028_0024.1
MYEKEEAAKARVTARKEQLEEMLSAGGAQFSFYEKDMQRIQDKKRRIEAHRNDKSKFQVISGLASVLESVQYVTRLVLSCTGGCKCVRWPSCHMCITSDLDVNI